MQRYLIFNGYAYSQFCWLSTPITEEGVAMFIISYMSFVVRHCLHYYTMAKIHNNLNREKRIKSRVC